MDERACVESSARDRNAETLTSACRNAWRDRSTYCVFDPLVIPLQRGRSSGSRFCSSPSIVPVTGGGAVFSSGSSLSIWWAASMLGQHILSGLHTRGSSAIVFTCNMISVAGGTVKYCRTYRWPDASQQPTRPSLRPHDERAPLLEDNNLEVSPLVHATSVQPKDGPDEALRLGVAVRKRHARDVVMDRVGGLHARRRGVDDVLPAGVEDERLD